MEACTAMAVEIRFAKEKQAMTGALLHLNCLYGCTTINAKDVCYASCMECACRWEGGCRRKVLSRASYMMLASSDTLP